MSLDDLRRRLDQIDMEIVERLDRRFRLSGEIGALKRREGIPLHQPAREEEVLEKIAALGGGGAPPESLKRVYRRIMDESLALQRRLPPSGTPPCPCSRKMDADVLVAENREIAPGFFRMRLVSPELAGAFRPGQFFQFQAEGALLRRPFAPSEYHEDGFSFVYAVVGGGTRRMAGLERGSRAKALAPLGNGFTLSPAPETAVLAGGGGGSPSLMPLAAALRAAGTGTTVLLGARSARLLLEKDAFAALAGRFAVATDDGSEGTGGTVVAALEELFPPAAALPGRLYACGPAPMLKALASWAAARGIPCEASLEERMACGFGACMGCAVAVKTPQGRTYARVCSEGPVFDASQLAWD